MGVASCSCDVGLESHGHISLLSLVVLPSAPWQPCHHMCGDGLPLMAFTPCSEDSQGDLAVVLGRGDKNRLKNCQLTFFFSPWFSQGGLEKAADNVGSFSL